MMTMMLLVAVVMYSRLKPVCLVTGAVPLRALTLQIQALCCAHLGLVLGFRHVSVVTAFGVGVDRDTNYTL